MSGFLFRFIISGLLLLLIQGCSSIGEYNLQERNASWHFGYQVGSELDSLFQQTEYDTRQFTGFYPL